MMNDETTITKDQGEHLAPLLAALHPGWDQPGILAALAKVRDQPLADVIVASTLAALGPTNRTPAVIAYDGDHWRRAHASVHAGEPQPSRPPDLGDACDTCGKPKDQCERTRIADDDHDYAPRREGLALRRADTERHAVRTAANQPNPGGKPYLAPELRQRILEAIAEGKAKHRQHDPYAPF